MASYRRRIEELTNRIEKALYKWEKITVTEYEEYRREKKKVLFFNFLLGVMRGVGFVIGVSIISAVVLAILAWLLSKSLNMPIIGRFIATIVDYVKLYSQNVSP